MTQIKHASAPLSSSPSPVQQLRPDAPLVVIGSGLAGWTAAREFRKIDPKTPILMFTSDGGEFYAKPALSNAFAQNKDATQLVTTSAEKMVSTVGVTLVKNTVVTSIDASTQEVETSTGRYGYRQLVLATGANPIKLPIEGEAFSEVMSINSLKDYRAFRAKTATNARVLIIGAGLIGCEFANDLGANGFNVHVVDPSPGPLNSLLPSRVSEELQNALSVIGIKWHLGTSVQTINYGAQSTLNVTLMNGQSIEVDVVLSAVGLKAECTLAQTAGAKCERGVLVDTKLQTRIEHIYALGDNTQYAAESVAGPARTLPYVLPIMNAARALAQTLSGNPTQVVFPVMPVVIKTPAFPIVIAPAAPNVEGEWRELEKGIWNFFDQRGDVRGFLLTGAQTTQRAEQVKRIAAN